MLNYYNKLKNIYLIYQHMLLIFLIFIVYHSYNNTNTIMQINKKELNFYYQNLLIKTYNKIYHQFIHWFMESIYRFSFQDKQCLNTFMI